VALAFLLRVPPFSKKDSYGDLLIDKEQQLTLHLSKEALGTGVEILRLLTSNLFIYLL